MKALLSKLKPFLYVGGLYIVISFVLRIIFMGHPITTTSFSLGQVLGMLLVGSFNDIFITILALSILVIYFLFIANVKYQKLYGYIILGAMLLLLCYIQFVPNNIFYQYGGSVEEIALFFFGAKTLCFAAMLFAGKWRRQVRQVLYFITLFIYTFAIVMNAVSEYFFWNEFGIRYNFIAVDYLIYTTEVIGNIMESYPVVPLFSGVFVVVLALTIFLYKKTKSTLETIPSLKEKGLFLGGYVALFLLSLWATPKFDDIKSNNVFVQEIRANGVYKFYYAFTHSELDFFQFYPTLPEEEARSTFFSNFMIPYPGFGECGFRNFAPIRELPYPVEGEDDEQHKNVVLISVESLSAEFMAAYGNTEGITPFLDSLAQKSIFLTNLYATGNRTVRGLEALTLCVPPTPGESIVKRKDNKDKFTTGSVFKSKGYSVKYLYGGYSYFDNMKDFFGGNGYDIIDRDNFTPEEITFANIWGVSDEDMARKAIKEMNAQAKTGKPFFNHWMTVSNHRPFTYPEGRIDIPGTAKSRQGGVKYTDYALKLFFELAKKESWFKDTVFVIVADHCASSAGRTELPLDRYRIPCLIYADFLEAEQIDKLASQIDVMPTVMELLNFSYESKFLGQDIFSRFYKPRAYIATYRELGYLTPDTLSIIKPLREQIQYKIVPEAEQPKVELPIFYQQLKVAQPDGKLMKKCISAYETTYFLLKNGELDK
ncbi:LTA synthase family protein [Capnocytophaga gingivalis]|uniref:LTA synthase family protein n=1 Tax=Capnocytophaga gingivalis TaxID=1017 RepID=UPI002B47C7C2|nr:sulfatase-like hydrolase/transferase [Capnocytophaga gingivalis]MEB3013080.1 sulfatase-like hydrolase/transferase [Capnocytophaga gingivalis]